MTTTIDAATHYLQPDWPAPAWIKAYTTLRASDIGELRVDKRQPGNVNRELLKSTLQLPADPVWLDQVHSAISVEATPDNAGVGADAIYTATPDQVCAVLTADCLPVLVCNKQGTKVAAIHAGWRGLANGIIEATLYDLAIPADDVLVWLGPAIGPDRFEVRRDVYDAFTHPNPAAADAFHPINAEQWLANLYVLARLRLQHLGIQQIYGGEWCTHSDPKKFFSYRRDGKILGHIVSLIWIADSIREL